MAKSLRRILEEERFKAQAGEQAWIDQGCDYEPPPTARYDCLCDLEGNNHRQDCPNGEPKEKTR